MASKGAAHGRVQHAIGKGVLVKQPCEVCGVSPADAHHDDYARPLDVRWLCRSHHKQWHGENGGGSGAEDSEALVGTRLTPSEHATLREYAAEADRSVAWLLRQWIRGHLELNKAAA